MDRGPLLRSVGRPASRGGDVRRAARRTSPHLRELDALPPQVAPPSCRGRVRGRRPHELGAPHEGRATRARDTVGLPPRPARRRPPLTAGGALAVLVDRPWPPVTGAR